MPSLHWHHCCCCTGVVAIVPELALPPSLSWWHVPCCASSIVALASTPLLCCCGHCHCSWNGVTLAFLLPSHLPWLVVASPLVTLFLLHCCLSMHSIHLLPPVCLPLSPAGHITSHCTTSAARCILSHLYFSLISRLVVALPLVTLPLPCVRSPHDTTLAMHRLAVVLPLIMPPFRSREQGMINNAKVLLSMLTLLLSWHEQGTTNNFEVPPSALLLPPLSSHKQGKIDDVKVPL